MKYFCNLTALLSIDQTANACFCALSPEIRQRILPHSAQLHTREELLLCAFHLLQHSKIPKPIASGFLLISPPASTHTAV